MPNQTVETGKTGTKDQLWSYKELLTMEKVALKVPKPGDYMRSAEAHTFETADGPMKVPARWVQRSTMPSKLKGHVPVLRRNFYCITEADLGKKITATVVVCERTCGMLTETYLDIAKTGEVLELRPDYELELVPNGQEGILIHMSTTRVHFAPRSHVLRALAQEAAA